MSGLLIAGKILRHDCHWTTPRLKIETSGTSLSSHASVTADVGHPPSLLTLAAFHVCDALVDHEEVGVNILSHGEHVAPNLSSEGVHLASEVAHVLAGKNYADEAGTVGVRAVNAAIVIAVAVFTKNLRGITMLPVSA